MGKNIIRLTENGLRNIIKEAILTEMNGNNLSDEEIITMAKMVVKRYGTGNMIDLNNPQQLVQDVRQVMQMNGCDEYNALMYMSGAKGGGW